MRSIDKIEVLENGYIQIRQANIIEKNGIEITRTFHRWVLAPGQDLENQEQKVKDIANVVWTKEIIETYKESLKNIETK